MKHQGYWRCQIGWHCETGIAPGVPTWTKRSRLPKWADPEEALKRLLQGQGARPETGNPRTRWKRLSPRLPAMDWWRAV